jgi:DNA-binding MarR family transcriptional regulator
MPNSDSEDLRADLLSLLDKQLEVLELSTCVTLTDEEWREFDARKQRIHELFKQLGTFGAAA